MMTNIFLLIPPVYAEGITNPVLPFAGQGEGTIIVGNLIGSLVGVFLIVGFILALFHFVFGAIRWITASGDKSSLQNAQERMTQAVVGLIMLATVWAIMFVVSTFVGWNQTGTNILEFPLPKLESTQTKSNPQLPNVNRP